MSVPRAVIRRAGRVDLLVSKPENRRGGRFLVDEPIRRLGVKMNFAGETTRAARRKADPSALAEAARLLREGALVAFPTETVYGLGADATNAAAVAKLYAAKGRPSFNPLIAHVADAEAAMREGSLSALAQKLASRLWPG